MKQAQKTFGFWIFLILLALIFFTFVQARRSTPPESLEFSRFWSLVESDRVKEVTIRGAEIEGVYVDEKSGQDVPFVSYGKLESEYYLNELRERNLTPNYEKVRDNPVWQQILVSILPLALIVFLFFILLRQIQVGGGKAMSFGKSRARLLSDSSRKVTFEDVAGVEECKEELEEIVSFLKDPKKFTRLGGRIPKGVLLMGTPGTGKTLLARAVAGEAGVPFFSISGSDFVEMFVGVGASRVRDLFEQGKKNAPCIIFIDEIDAVGRHRGAGLGGGHDEREQTLNQLLVEMDGFESNDGVILIAATNRPDVLDPALLRPGRFDRRVVVPRPDVKGREGILKVHTRRVPLGSDVDLDVIARSTPGFSGADLESLVNEAALLAARADKKSVEMVDFDSAKDKVMMGSERRSMVITDGEKRTTAYHEAGHAIVAEVLPGADPIHKVTIIPRGQALGLTQQLPVDERHTYDRDYLLNNITILMGGRAAEELALEVVTTGAGNDIERATDIARKMVCEWGMSETLGPLTFGKKQESIFLGREIAQHQDYSESTAVEIDSEVKRLVTDCYGRARQILQDNVHALHQLATLLLEKESVDGKTVAEVVRAYVRGHQQNYA
ncbi:ATP-dependent zinc metalloprotease FtsH [Myxococcota bacterium]|nr:ATP-dependent zinc metalloprotease FtsH [Myxococcota bacterium]